MVPRSADPRKKIEVFIDLRSHKCMLTHSTAIAAAVRPRRWRQRQGRSQEGAGAGKADTFGTFPSFVEPLKLRARALFSLVGSPPPENVLA